MWEAFSIIKKSVPSHIFEQVIKEHLSFEKGIVLSKAIIELSSLSVHGIITLNIDEVSEIMIRANRSVLINSATNMDIGKKASAILNESRPFIVHLHGKIDDPDSWIFSERDLGKILSDDAYKLFLSTVFISWRVIFLGVSADDVAISEHLNTLSELGIKMNHHYWITNRADRFAHEWSEKTGINIISYQSKDIDHEAALEHMFHTMKNHRYRRPAPPPVNPGMAGVGVVLSPNQVMQMEPEEARFYLSSMATNILNNCDDYSRYSEFRKEYGVALNHASYISEDSPHNKIFGYTIKKKLGGGAFGVAYEDVGLDGNRYAIKILKKNATEDNVMLRSFRRGIESMRILKDNNIEGMVELYATYETPPCIIMEMIDGPNLSDGLKSGHVKDIIEKLLLSLRIGRILMSAHHLTQTVIHRDVRPPNIMFRNKNPNAFKEDDIVVLDFDLSWHVGAADFELSPQMTTILGYLAPEQLYSGGSIDTQTALVDSYGYCMTLLYIFSGENPEPNQSALENWERRLEKIRTNVRSYEWESIPNRIIRIIKNGSIPDIGSRYHFDMIVNEISNLYKLSSGNDGYISEEYLIEEMACRSFGEGMYDFDESQIIARSVNLPGIKFDILRGVRGDEYSVRIDVGISETGFENWRHIGKYFKDKSKQIRGILESSGWSVSVISNQRDIVLISAEKSPDRVFSEMEYNINNIKRCISIVKF